MNKNNKKSLLFLANPKSGNGFAESIFQRVDRVLKKNNIHSILYVSKKRGDIKNKIISMDLTKFDAIIIIGGDGTINEAVNGLIRSGKSHYLPLGLIPSGSGNAFASDLNLNTIDQAVENILKFNLMNIDVMKINYNNSTTYSINILGWGMASRVNKIAEKLRFFGGMRYSIASIFCILFLKPKSMDINIDDISIKCKGLFFLALNTIHTGKGMRMAPNAKLNDGLLDFIYFENASRWNVFQIFLKIFSGNHIHCKGVEYLQGKEFSINTSGDSLNIDGENYGVTPVTVRLMKNKLKIFNGFDTEIL